MDSCGSKKHVLDRSSHWRQLANMTELSVCGGDAAYLSNYFDHLFLLVSLHNRLLVLSTAALKVCRENASRKCRNGMCLPKSLTCDGVAYCPDGSTTDVLCRECALWL